MSKITWESTIDRKYLRNRTKEEIIDHCMRLLSENDSLRNTLEIQELRQAVNEAMRLELLHHVTQLMANQPPPPMIVVGAMPEDVKP